LQQDSTYAGLYRLFHEFAVAGGEGAGTDNLRADGGQQAGGVAEGAGRNVLFGDACAGGFANVGHAHQVVPS
jgi:hypothetical protein